MIKYYIEFISQVPLYLLLLLSASGVIFGDFSAKMYTQNSNEVFFILSILGYICSGLFFIPTLFKENLVIASIFWEILAISGMLFMGFFIFGEKITKLQTIGMLVSIIGLIILIIANNLIE